jgi:hypothetical protein
MTPRFFVVLVALLTAPVALAEVTFRSGPTRVALLELYTSEGCSSCPAAEKWLGEFRQDAGLWSRFVPVEFHVNYWDHLGWKDVFATKDFTRREYTYADTWGSSSVYTPCVVRNGAEFNWRGELPQEKNAPTVGTLAIAYADDGTCRATFVPPASTRDTWVVNVALLGGGFVSRVKSGENAGRNLTHEFVALQLSAATLTEDKDGARTATLKITDPDGPLKSARRALAAWVTKRGSLASLQATGGWIGSPK